MCQTEVFIVLQEKQKPMSRKDIEAVLNKTVTGKQMTSLVKFFDVKCERVLEEKFVPTKDGRDYKKSYEVKHYWVEKENEFIPAFIQMD